MTDNQLTHTTDAIIQRIFELRGQRVMLDSDLAELYGVETRAVIQAVKRSPARFEDFVFQLSTEEWENLRSQNVISSLRCQIGTSKHGGRRYPPYAFTEHGALMLSSVLKSSQADQISRMVIRAFVWLRQAIPAYKELAAKVAELENAVTRHDAALDDIVKTLRQLIAPAEKEKRRIGF